MKNRYKTIPLLAALGATVLCGSCADEWDDHYAEAGLPTGGTLWEAIEADGNLSNFASVVKGCGYDVILAGNQNYSIYAPTNDYFSKQEAESLIAEYEANKAQGVRASENPTVRQFIQNHIALYKHPVSTLTNDTLTMLNGKYQQLSPTTVGGRKMLSSNKLCGNGMLFTLDGQLTYFPNVYEQLGQDAELDSVYQFVKGFNEYVFQADKSVPGGINADGQTEYLDSVSVLNNYLFDNLGDINNEDSSYIFLAPTNSEWERVVPEYEKYFTYNSAVSKRDSLQHANARLAAIMGNVFNANASVNQSLRDSAYSTSALSYAYRSTYGEEPYGIYYNPYEAGKGVFDGATSTECSNGQVLKTSNYRVSPYQTLIQTIKVEGEATYDVDSLMNVEDPLTTVEVSEDNPFYNQVSRHGYVEVVPDPTAVDADHKPWVRYKVDGLLSNVGYDIYVVLVPAIAGDTLASAESRLPHIIQVSLSYLDANGIKQTVNLRNGRSTNFKTDEDKFGLSVDSMMPLKVATNQQFPCSSYGLDDSGVTVTIRSNVEQNQTTKYSRTMRIDCVIFKPHDLPADLWMKSND